MDFSVEKETDREKRSRDFLLVGKISLLQKMNPVYAGEYRGGGRRTVDGDGWRKSLNIDVFVHFELLYRCDGSS